jgi:hypothetical protein
MAGIIAVVNALSDASLLDFLRCDPRPTFILDKAVTTSQEGVIVPVYSNSALVDADFGKLRDAITGKSAVAKAGSHQLATFSKFRSWAIKVQNASEQFDHVDEFIHCRFRWIKIPFQDRWTIISGTFTGMVDLSPTNESVNLEKSISARPCSKTDDSKSVVYAGVSQSNSFDWTREFPPAKANPHIVFARSIDWSSTSLGPMRTWSPQLRNTANVVMQDPRPAVLFWGADAEMIYNEPYVALLGELHPACMGTSARICLADVWDHFEPIIARNIAGEAVEETNTPLFIIRSGFLEETYFSLKFIPILDNDGATIGHYETVTETVSCFPVRRILSSNHLHHKRAFPSVAST